MNITGDQIIPFLVALSFAAGLNVYATTGTLGILGHFGWISLPPGLTVLSNHWIIGASLLCFACEFFADKIPYVDLVWNVVHTFIRIPVAALLAYRASVDVSPQMQWAMTAVGAGVAAIAHGGKTAARTIVSASPEPISNIGLSSAEDAVAIGLVWVATNHPWIGGIAAGSAVIVCLLCLRWIIRGAQRQWHRLQESWA